MRGSGLDESISKVCFGSATSMEGGRLDVSVARMMTANCMCPPPCSRGARRYYASRLEVVFDARLAGVGDVLQGQAALLGQRVLRTQRRLLDGEGPLQQRSGGRRVTLAGEQDGEVVHAPRGA